MVDSTHVRSCRSSTVEAERTVGAAVREPTIPPHCETNLRSRARLISTPRTNNPLSGPFDQPAPTVPSGDRDRHPPRRLAQGLPIPGDISPLVVGSPSYMRSIGPNRKELRRSSRLKQNQPPVRRPLRSQRIAYSLQQFSCSCPIRSNRAQRGSEAALSVKDDFPTVGRPIRSVILSLLAGNSCEAFAVGVHRKDVLVSIASRTHERDQFPRSRPHGFRVQGFRSSQSPRMLPVQPDLEDLVVGDATISRKSAREEEVSVGSPARRDVLSRIRHSSNSPAIGSHHIEAAISGECYAAAIG
jgi:hypothetical protein